MFVVFTLIKTFNRKDLGAEFDNSPFTLQQLWAINMEHGYKTYTWHWHVNQLQLFEEFSIFSAFGEYIDKSSSEVLIEDGVNDLDKLV